MIAKFGNAACINLLYILTSEEVPTTMRGLAFGITGCIGRGGAIASSMLAIYLKERCLIFMIAMSIMGALVSLILIVFDKKKANIDVNTWRGCIQWKSINKINFKGSIH